MQIIAIGAQVRQVRFTKVDPRTALQRVRKARMHIWTSFVGIKTIEFSGCLMFVFILLLQLISLLDLLLIKQNCFQPIQTPVHVQSVKLFQAALRENINIARGRHLDFAINPYRNIRSSKGCNSVTDKYISIMFYTGGKTISQKPPWTASYCSSPPLINST